MSQRAADPLNAPLFKALVDIFGDVRVAMEGDEGAYDVTRDGASYVARYASGEVYEVNCPVCGDERRRLRISHWAFRNIRRGSARVHTGGLMHCHNENCDLSDLKLRLKGVLRDTPPTPSKIGERVRREPEDDPHFPDNVVPIDSPDANAACREYLLGRGFDLRELSEVWEVGAVDDMPEVRGGPRIIYPVRWNGKRVFWQARTAFNPTREQQRAGVHKYHNPPGAPKSHYLYNRDGVMGSRVVVLVEGVTDVHKIGPCAAAIFGKCPSERQMQIISNTILRKAAGVLLLDGDVDYEKDIAPFEGRYGGDRLFEGGLAVVRLPPDKDPGDMSREEVWDYIDRACGGAAL